MWTLVVILCALGILGVGAYAGVSALVDEWCQDLPDVHNADAFDLPEKTTILANDGTTVLASLYLEDREPVTIDQVSRYVLNGTVATEDERFYQHNGVDPAGIVRAVFVNLGGGQEGASTITQQFIRNTLLSDEMNDITIKRKVREMVLALELEKVYSKDQILMMYLNTINYGDGCYGIEVAAEHYFSRSASDLTLAQAATLVGIPNSPTLYNPVTNPDNALQRRNLVLSRMLSNGYISQDDYNEAVNEPLGLNVSERDTDDGIYKYPWFTSYVRDQLIDKYSTDVVFSGGLTVVTSIDPELQDYADQACATEYASGTMLDGQEIALTCIDPDTGFILAMVGGRDYDADQYNIATSEDGRQTGSSFKMFTLTAAIEQGINPWNTYMNCNSPVTVDGTTFNNYGNQSYGYLSIADMTAVSSNTGYIRLVTDDGGVTPASIVEMANRMGLNEDSLQPYPSITLGAFQANTTQMASAYATLAANGVQHDPVAIVKVTDSKGNVLEDNSAGSAGTQVISKEVAYATTQVLEGVITSSYGTASAAKLPSGQVAAGKTGTTDDWRDLWWCGYTPQLSCSVWVGSRDNSLEQYTYPWAQDVWREFMTKALADSPIEDFQTAAAPTYNSKYTGYKKPSSSSSSSSSSSRSSSSSLSSDDEYSSYSSYSSGTQGNTGHSGNTGNTGNTGDTSGTGNDSGSGSSSSSGGTSGSGGTATDENTGGGSSGSTSP